MHLTPSLHRDTFCRDHLPPFADWPVLEFTRPELRYPTTLNCASELLDGAIAAHGAHRRCLLTPDGEVWTYGDLATRVDQLAHVLTADLGLVPGNRVLLRAPNNPWLVACWYAVLKAGGVVVTTVPALRSGELRQVGDIARVDLALCDHRFTGDLVAADVAPVHPVGGGGPDDLVVRAAGRPDRFAAVPTAADDVALLAFTSGTTGRPKATMHFHRDVLAIADTFSRNVLRPTPDDLFVGSPPLGFTFGLGALVIFPMRAGAASLLIEKPSPDALRAAVTDRGATILSTAPTAYRALLDGMPANALPSLRRCVSAAEPLDADTWRRFRDATGVKIIDGIGATEMLHIFVSAADDDIRPGATGLPVPGFRATVLDEDGHQAPVGAPGLLAVRGPTGCRYLDDPPRQAEYVRDGWNVTGDTYVRDDDGYLWFQARRDDMIISAGYNIAGPEVEQALLRHPDVLEVAVVGVPDPERTMSVRAYVVLRPGRAEDAGALRDHCAREIAPYKRPRQIEFLSALPRNSTGKVVRHRLREDAARTATA